MLEVDGAPAAYFADPLCDTDLRVLGFERGSCRGQAAAEALAILVALRLWFPLWRGSRAAVAVRSDSQAALGALGKLGSTAPAVGRVAREVALDVALSCYGVDVWQHLPAERNVEADRLSRWAEPGGDPTVPSRLVEIRRDIPDAREESWWMAASAEWRRRADSVHASGATCAS